MKFGNDNDDDLFKKPEPDTGAAANPQKKQSATYVEFKERGDNMLFSKKLWLGLLSILFLALSTYAAASMLEQVDASEYVVIQSPISGDLTWYTQPGLALRLMGKVTRYPKSSQYQFLFSDERGFNDSLRKVASDTQSASQQASGLSERTRAIKTTFNDGGDALISGTVRYDLPSDEKFLTKMHTTFRSAVNLESDLVARVVRNSIFASGPMMSSAESYMSRRLELQEFIDDQIAFGVYRTETKDSRVEDPITGEKKTIRLVKTILQADAPRGLARRTEQSPVLEYGIRIHSLSIDRIVYSDRVNDQIVAQQKITMDTQTSAAEAKQSEQKAITAAKNGEAEAAKAKWAEEALKAAAVTQAQKEKEVAILNGERQREIAKLEKESAEYYKQSQILRGEGDAGYKNLVMQADGALEQKIKAYVEANKAWAAAIGNYQGSIVPQIITGGSSGAGNSNSAIDLIELLKVKTAKDLALDIGINPINNKKQ